MVSLGGTHSSFVTSPLTGDHHYHHQPYHHHQQPSTSTTSLLGSTPLITTNTTSAKSLSPISSTAKIHNISHKAYHQQGRQLNQQGDLVELESQQAGSAPLASPAVAAGAAGGAGELYHNVKHQEPRIFNPNGLAMVVRNADGTVNVEHGRQGFFAPSTNPELIGQRKYRGHRGRNRFLCDGRVLMSSHNGAFFITLALIFSTMTSFFVFDAVYMAENVSIAMPIIAAVLFLLVMANLLKTSFTDPGIIPRSTNKEVVEQERLYKLETGNPNATIPRTKMVEVFSECVVQKYCFTCRLFRPPRASHCSVCDNCVLRFDHHCPWVGNCVGLRNYRNFYLFILLLTILDFFVGACAISHLVLLSIDQKTFINAIRTSPGSLFVGLVCLISVWSVLGLSGFHTYLIASNQTTNEEVKDTFADLWPSYCGSLYSTGNLFTNCWHTLCGAEPPSLLDRRGKITPDPVIQVQPEMLLNFKKPKPSSLRRVEVEAAKFNTDDNKLSAMNRGGSTGVIPATVAASEGDRRRAAVQSTQSMPVSATSPRRITSSGSCSSTSSSIHSVHSYSSSTVHSVRDAPQQLEPSDSETEDEEDDKDKNKEEPHGHSNEVDFDDEDGGTSTLRNTPARRLSVDQPATVMYSNSNITISSNQHHANGSIKDKLGENETRDELRDPNSVEIRVPRSKPGNSTNVPRPKSDVVA